MEDPAGKPEDKRAPSDAAQRSQGKTYQFSQSRPLPVSEGPILIQEKAVYCTHAEGQRIVSQEYGSTGGGKQQQQAIQNQQIHQGIQPTDQAKTQHLPEQARPKSNTMSVGALFIGE